ncbi:MAG TPA: helix-turn-helix transcriptional regulator [Leptolyngbyaceae cyanobacterium]
MTIKWRLAAVMADREIDNQQLQSLTGLHAGTISKLRNNPPKRIDTETLDTLCKALNCEPGELLRYVAD